MAAVPQAAGVPALLTGYSAAAPLTLLSADLVTVLGISIAPQWGIFRGGAPVVTADTVMDFTYKQEWMISDYPLEQGAFESYDKVALPYDVRLRFVAGGSAASRAALLASVMAIAGDLNLYDAVTPEAVYTSCNVRHYDFHRSPTRGLGLLTVDIWLTWVRTTTGTSSGNVATSSAASQVNGGTVQSSAASSAQESAAAPGSQETTSGYVYDWASATPTPQGQ